MLRQGTFKNGEVIFPANSSQVLVKVDDAGNPVPGGGGGGDIGTSSEVEITNWPSSLAVSGPLTNAQLTAISGTAAQTNVASDPSSAGLTILSLLRGILAEMQTQTAILNDIKANTEQPEPESTPDPEPDPDPEQPDPDPEPDED